MLKTYHSNPFTCICDNETTGFSPLFNDLIVTSLEIRDADFNLQAEKTFYAKPKSKKGWTEKAEEVHGFSFDEAMSFKSSRKVAIEILHFLAPFRQQDNSPLLFVAHDLNAFDFLFLECFFAWENLQFSLNKVLSIKNKLSTISMARKAGYSENSLDVWAKRLNFKLDHHEAKSDRMACSNVYDFLRDKDVKLEKGKQKTNKVTQRLLL